jgi:hypothetical protein
MCGKKVSFYVCFCDNIVIRSLLTKIWMLCNRTLQILLQGH